MAQCCNKCRNATVQYSALYHLLQLLLSLSLFISLSVSPSPALVPSEKQWSALVG